MGNYKSTGLWKRSLGKEVERANEDALAILKGTYHTFRDRAAHLTTQIARDLPNLTIHDVTHLDALWETADLIAGDDYPLNPAEGFVLGGAILLHDAALCFEAYEGGRPKIRETLEWKDAFVAIRARDSKKPRNECEDEADFATIRLLHASQASELATRRWTTPEGEDLNLIENHALRKHYGTLIGDIASSHHWSIEDVASKLPKQLNAPAGLPLEWRVDPIKIACLLRCADAAHLDSRRAPDFLRVLAVRHGISASHWAAQNWLERVDYDASNSAQIIYTSGKPFDEASAEAWWVAYDAIQLVDRELSSSADLLEKRSVNNSPPFQVRRVTGAGSPDDLSQSIRTTGWTPRAVEIHVSNLERLVSELGGDKLYGEEQPLAVALRELIQNARDAIMARTIIDPSYSGSIRVIHETDGYQHTIAVEDNGVGMSERIITGPLLDFGTSFWASDLARQEFPGLLSRGYRSVGRFGIGFYSVFMAASAVTVASRRFDAAYDAVTQVKFSKGLSLRPLIVAGAPPGFPSGKSTRVEIQIKPELGDPHEIVIREARPGYEEEIKINLGRCLSILCAGLDVIVEFVDKFGNSTVVHRPLSEINNDESRREWLSIIIGNEGHKDIANDHADRLRPIVGDGNIYGLAALSTIPDRVTPGFYSIKTVGGLAERISVTGVSGFIGVIDYEPKSAKRSPSEKVHAGHEALKAWAKEQISLLPDRKTEPGAWCVATMNLSELEIDPIDICTIPIIYNGTISMIDIEEVIDLICLRGLAFFQSPHMEHVDTFHRKGAYEGFPTFWPILNSSFLSLRRDKNGKSDVMSVLSCIERRAEARGLTVIAQYAPETVSGVLGAMPVLLLTIEKKSS